MQAADEKLISKFRETIKKFRPIDDTFMRVLFRENIPLAEYVLRLITNTPDLKIIRENTQFDLKRQDGGRSICLDVFAEDSKGTLYDIEIQRSDKGASPKRARYHSAALDVEFLDKGKDFECLCETYIIFITENDFFGEGELAYHYVRTSLSKGKHLNDGTHILYLNASYSDPEDKSELALLMHDFLCSDPDKMQTEILARNAKNLKNSEGELKMCKIMEEFLIEDHIELAKKMLTNGLPIEDIADYTNLPIETIEKLKEELTLITV